MHDSLLQRTLFLLLRILLCLCSLERKWHWRTVLLYFAQLGIFTGQESSQLGTVLLVWTHCDSLIDHNFGYDLIDRGGIDAVAALDIGRATVQRPLNYRLDVKAASVLETHTAVFGGHEHAHVSNDIVTHRVMLHSEETVRVIGDLSCR